MKNLVFKGAKALAIDTTLASLGVIASWFVAPILENYVF